MRDKFTDLIQQGVTSFYPVNIIPDMPEPCELCRIYNNIFSMATDTHMSKLDEDTYVITGHMINTPKWRNFITSSYWGGYQIANEDFFSLSEFLYKNGLEGHTGEVNGDIVYVVTKQPEPMTGNDTMATPEVAYFTTSESQIPHPIVELTTNGDINKIKECLTNDLNTTVQKLNESAYIKGNKWIISEKQIVGLVGNKVIFLENKTK